MEAMLKLQDKWGQNKHKKKVVIKQEQPKPLNEVYSREEFFKLEEAKNQAE